MVLGGSRYFVPSVRVGFWGYSPLIIALALRVASAPTANLSYFLLAAYALKGRPHAIRALAMSWLFTMLNPGIAPVATAGPVGRYAILFAAAFSAIMHSHIFSRRPRLRPFTLATIMLGGFIIGHSILFSSMVDVSVLKAVSWTLAMAASISLWCGLTPWEREHISSEIFFGLVFVLIISLPFIGTGVGYLRNGTGFQGALNHPQSFGPTMGLLGAWAASLMIGAGRQPPWWLIGVVGSSVACILMSEARTAGLSMIFGVGLAILFGPGLAGKTIGEMLPGLKSPRIWGLLVALSVVGTIAAPTISNTAQHYLTKSGRAQVDGLFQAYDRSRGRLIDQMLANINDHPLTGIGFGIASELETMVISRDPILNLPVGASIEKGVVPLAIIEELGLFGGLLAFTWLWCLIRRGAQGGTVPLAICTTIVILNMGEATFFSPGGLGLLPIILLGWAYSSGRAQTRGRLRG